MGGSNEGGWVAMHSFGMKGAAHALAGGRVGTAVVLLVGMHSGFPARDVLREHGRHDQQSARGLPRMAAVLTKHASSGEPRLHTD
jgi:hypothetical protein